MSQQNMGTERICGTKIINNWKKDIEKHNQTTKDRAGTWWIKTNDELNNLIRNNIVNHIKPKK